MAAALAAVWTAPAMAQDLTRGAAATRDAALASPLAYDLVESLTTEVGARPVGTPAMAKARDWALARLTALGFENVHAEPFTTRVWVRGPESAAVVGPYPQALSILGLANSTPTPPGGLTAPIALFHTYREMLAQPPGALAGKIAVVTERMPRTRDLAGYKAVNPGRTAGPREAAARGAVGYLLRSVSTADTRLPHTGLSQPGGIPAAALSTPDAELLERMAARGAPVTVRLDMRSSVVEAATSWNVMGEIRGSAAPAELIVVGGHLDSWDPGTGAVDNAAGVAITLAAARIAGQDRPRRTIRVVFWGSEEQGGGGRSYAAAHAAEMGRVVLAGESDLGAGRIYGVNLPRGASGHPAMRAFLASLPPLKVEVSPQPPSVGGTDIEGLMAQGVPFADLSPDASRYFDWHHSADDTLDKIDPAALAQNVAVWAGFLYTVAHSDIDFRALGSASQ